MRGLGIREDRYCFKKRDTVFLEIPRRFRWIPREHDPVCR